MSRVGFQLFQALLGIAVFATSTAHARDYGRDHRDQTGKPTQPTAGVGIAPIVPNVPKDLPTPEWADDSHRECGLECQYGKGNELIILDHDALAQRVTDAADHIQQAKAYDQDKKAGEATAQRRFAREVLQGFCDQDPNGEDVEAVCLPRVMVYQKRRDDELSRAFVENTTHRNDLNMDNAPGAQAPMFASAQAAKEAGLKPQITPLETVDQAVKDYNDFAKKHPEELEYYGSKSYEDWVRREFRAPPKPGEFVKMKTIDDPINPGQKIKVVLRDSNGDPIQDPDAYVKAKRAYDNSSDERADLANRFDAGNQAAKSNHPKPSIVMNDEVRSAYDRARANVVNAVNRGLQKRHADSGKNWSKGMPRDPASMKTAAKTAQQQSGLQVHEGNMGSHDEYLDLEDPVAQLGSQNPILNAESINGAKPPPTRPNRGAANTQ